MSRVNRFSAEELAELSKNFRFKDDAVIDLAQANAPKIFEKLEIDLGKERPADQPLKLAFAFKSVYVQDASDSGAEIEMKPYSNQESNDAIALRKNGVANFDQPIQNVIITNKAQAGKKMTLIFIFNGYFRPGSLFTEVSSAVKGNSINVGNAIAVTTTPVQLVAQNLNRTLIEIQASGNVEISGSETGNFFPIGTSKVLENTAEIWVKTVSGSEVVEYLEFE